MPGPTARTPLRWRGRRKAEAVVEGRLVLAIDDEAREAVVEALANLLLTVTEREGLIVLADASQ